MVRRYAAPKPRPNKLKPTPAENKQQNGKPDENKPGSDGK